AMDHRVVRSAFSSDHTWPKLDFHSIVNPGRRFAVNHSAAARVDHGTLRYREHAPFALLFFAVGVRASLRKELEVSHGPLDLDSGVHAGAKLMVWILHVETHRERSRILIEVRMHEGKFALKRFTRGKGRGTSTYWKSLLQVSQLVLVDLG